MMTTMKRAAVLGFTLAVLASPAAAQKVAPDAATIAAAKDVIAASGGRADALKAMSSMKGAYLAQLRGQSPEMVKKIDELMTKYMDDKSPRIQTYLDEMEAVAIDFYASRFTVDELKTIGAFQLSAAGQKFRSVVPELMASMTAPMLKFQQGLSEELQKELKP